MKFVPATATAAPPKAIIFPGVICEILNGADCTACAVNEYERVGSLAVKSVVWPVGATPSVTVATDVPKLGMRTIIAVEGLNPNGTDSAPFCDAVIATTVAGTLNCNTTSRVLFSPPPENFSHCTAQSFTCCEAFTTPALGTP